MVVMVCVVRFGPCKRGERVVLAGVVQLVRVVGGRNVACPRAGLGIGKPLWDGDSDGGMSRYCLAGGVLLQVGMVAALLEDESLSVAGALACDR